MPYGIRPTFTSGVNERIRRCTPSDAAAIAAIYDPIVATTTISFEETPPGEAEMRRRIVATGDAYPWLALERQGTLAGYVYASPHRSRDAYRWSVDVSAYVAPECKRQGIARRLYTVLFELLALQGYNAAFAGVALPNEASLHLHRSIGFAEIGTYHRVGFKFGQWHDVTWLERLLLPDDSAPLEPRSLATFGP
jgi:L-amino acid N-acyltransferase YncA